MISTRFGEILVLNKDFVALDQVTRKAPVQLDFDPFCADALRTLPSYSEIEAIRDACIRPETVNLESC